MTSCTDCPDLPNGTRKRQVCCMREGQAGRRARAEAAIIEKMGATAPPPTGVRLVRASALSSSLLGSALVGGFVPEIWDGRPRLAAPLTPVEQATVAGRNAA